MSTNTSNFNFILPAVNNPTDANVWGNYINANTTSLDSLIRNIANCNIGSSAPSTPKPQPGTLWINNSASTWPMQVYDGSTWVSIGTINPTSHTFITAAGFLNVQIFATTGSTLTYTPTSGMTFCIVEIIGGGGGGGGVQGVVTPGGIAASGGGAGAYCKSWFTAAQIGASQSVVIGAGGTGGSGAANGNAGNVTTFGSGAVLFSANGGTGGIGGNSGRNSGYSVIVAGTNATPVGGNMVNAKGAAGGTGISMAADSNCSGCGGASFFGAGGSSVSSNSNGNSGLTPGSGGSGAAILNGLSAYTGGNGANGVCIITEFGI